MLPEFDHRAIVTAAARAGFTAAVLAEICRIPVASVEAIFAGERESCANLLDLLPVSGTLRLTMLQVFPWAKSDPPPGRADFEILFGNRSRRWFRVVEASPASDGGRAEAPIVYPADPVQVRMMPEGKGSAAAAAGSS